MLPPSIDQFVRTYHARPPAKGPTVLFAIVWFGLLVGASLLGTWPLAVLFGLLGAVGALQGAAAWRAASGPVNAPLAGLAAFALPFAATANNRVLGAVVLVIVVLSLVLGADLVPNANSFRPDTMSANLAITAGTLRLALPLGFVGASVVQLERIDLMALVFLVMVVSVYDAGWFLIGTTSPGRFHGIWAGLAGNLVVLFAVSAMHPEPFDTDGVVRIVAVLAALACPLGQWLGSWMLPTARAKAPALRRLDSWLITAPLVWIAAGVVS